MSGTKVQPGLQGGPGETPPGAPPPDWLAPILGGGYEFTPEDLQAIAAYLAQAQAQQGIGQLGLDQAQLGYQGDYLNRYLIPQLDYQSEQLDYERGRAPIEDALARMGYDTQRLGYQTQQGIYGEQTQQSKYDTQKSSNYALAQEYDTQAARYAADAARWNAMAQMGFVQPTMSWQDRNAGRGYGYG